MDQPNKKANDNQLENLINSGVLDAMVSAFSSIGWLGKNGLFNLAKFVLFTKGLKAIRNFIESRRRTLKANEENFLWKHLKTIGFLSCLMKCFQSLAIRWFMMKLRDFMKICVWSKDYLAESESGCRDLVGRAKIEKEITIFNNLLLITTSSIDMMYAQ